MIGARVHYLLLIAVGTATICGCQAFLLDHILGNSNAGGPPLALVDDELEYAKPGISVAELLEFRGYKAQKFKFTTRDGYVLHITRGTNPLINKGERGLDDKLPILFLHGSTLPATTFILNSAGVKPKVYDSRGVNTGKLTSKKLSKMLKGEPSVYSLPFLAMNFGYECWFLDRRGFRGSRSVARHENRTLADAMKALPMSLLGNILDGFSLNAGLEDNRPIRGRSLGFGPKEREANASVYESIRPSKHDLNDRSTRSTISSSSSPKRSNFLQAMFALIKLTKNDRSLIEKQVEEFIETFNPNYWRFSLDEQAEFDFPQAIDFVLEKTGKHKVHTVGMSCGGAIILLALADKPELADKISKAVLWAPSVNMGSNSDIVYLMSHAIPPLQGYVGPLPFIFLVPMMEKFLTILCSPEFMQRTICEAAYGSVMGFSGGQGPLKPFMAGNMLRPTGVFELTQLGQMSRTETPCKLQLNSKEENIQKYGQEKAPCYDLGEIRLHNMSIYVGNTDALVSIDDMKTTARQLSVPVELNLINKRGVFFNHMGYFSHKNADKLAIVPSLLDFERSEQ